MEKSPDRPSANAVSFEGQKLFLKQDGRGFVLSILIHPADVPMDLMLAPISTRYTVAMVEHADDGSVVVPKLKTEGERLVTSAAMLCENDRFQKWLYAKELVVEPTMPEASDYVRRHCGIGSRSELRDNMAARELFKSLREEFNRDVKSGKA